MRALGSGQLAPALFHALASFFRSLAKEQNVSPLFPIVCSLFAKNSRGVPKLFFTSEVSSREANLKRHRFPPPICRIQSSPRTLFQLASAHVPSLPSPRRASPHHQTRRSSCPRRARLDEYVYRGHHDGRPPPQQRRRHRSRRPWLKRFHHHRPLRSRTSPRTRHPRLASLRRRPARRLPSLARQQHLPQHRAHAVASRTRVAASPLLFDRWRKRCRCRTCCSLRQSACCWPLATPSLFRRAPLPPGHEHGSSCRIRSHLGEHHQRGWQLCPHLRQMGISEHGHGRLRLVHRCRARIYGVSSRGLFALVRPQAPHRTSQDAHRHRLSAHKAIDRPRFSGGNAVHARERCLRARDSFNRATRPSSSRNASDRAEHRRVHLHGSARNFDQTLAAPLPLATPPFFSAQSS